ncbi:hypothetical protein LEN26_011267 [Aphanomyces euteiches]|nr:hypothetical protein AeMF1_014082 [Aphanomyces euteiches]KAH9120143.1 hypothetical protein LEN26_011267 [Aphanomyces euteiches]KAH9189581.1 hypothetical protein AeNC1_008442 [Aphanomyces euteiches]
MLACSYGMDFLWMMWASVAMSRGQEVALGLLTSSGTAFMITWYSLRIYDRYAFTALLHSQWGVWSASSVLGILMRIFDGAIHIVWPSIMLCWYLRHVKLWMTPVGMLCVATTYRLRQTTKSFPVLHRYIFYQFSPERSHHFWAAAFKLEMILHGCIPFFCWIAQQHAAFLYSITIMLGGLAVSVQLLRSLALPKIRFAAGEIMQRLLLQGQIHAAAALTDLDSSSATPLQMGILVHDPKFWLDWMSDGLVAIGESYVSGQWSLHPRSENTLDGILFRLLTLPVEARREMYQSWSARLVSLSTRLFYFESSAASHIIGPATTQFDFGPSFRRRYLGPYMHQSFGLWTDLTDNDLEMAEDRSLRLIAQKLNLTPGHVVLDLHLDSAGGVGCFLAHKFRVQVISIVRTMQERLAALHLARQHNIQSHVQFLCLDSDELLDVLRPLSSGGFDAITASRLLETSRDVSEILSLLKTKLRPGGRLVVDFVATPTRANTHAWSNKYISPALPTIALSYATVRTNMTDVGWVVVEAQHYAEHFDRTYVAWHAAFQADASTLPDSFRRTWEFYLLHTAACFRARNLQIYQVTLQP